MRGVNRLQIERQTDRQTGVCEKEKIRVQDILKRVNRLKPVFGNFCFLLEENKKI